MKLSPAQLKGRIKSLAQKHHADPRILLRIYMMERFLERLSCSAYRDNFIIKGGILVTSMIGVALRSTMDIDASIKNANLSEEDLLSMLIEISSMGLDDGIIFNVKHLDKIMDEMEYPGIRVAMEARLDKMPVPLKLDISTGDVITPREITYEYKLLLEEKTISLWSYNLETILAEKMQTVLTRGVLNTRMRDFYDIHELTLIYRSEINIPNLQDAFAATCKKRDTQQIPGIAIDIIKQLKVDARLQELWQNYQRKFSYADSHTYHDIISSIEMLWQLICRV